MSAIPESLRRQWLPVTAAAAVCLVASVAWLSLARSAHTAGEATSLAAPGASQAQWRVDVSLEGRVGKLTDAQRKAFNRERPSVVALVEDIYEAMFLFPSRLDDLVAKHFTQDAARSLRPSNLGFPTGTRDVRTLRRVARIGIQATGGRNAAANVKVVAAAKLREKKVKIQHASTLWLSRKGRNWKVIGFEVEQRPTK